MKKILLFLVFFASFVESACPDGAIASECDCGSKVFSRGFCCSGVYFDEVYYSSCPGNIYFVDSKGSDTNAGTSWQQAKKTIRAGIALLQAGDALVIRNGTYTGERNRIINVPGGAPGRYTIIRAEDDWGVVVNGTPSYSAYFEGASYIMLRGIHFRNYSGVKVYLLRSNHMKVIRCSSDDNGGNAPAFLNTASDYNLFEECFHFGKGRYPFQVRYNSNQERSHYVIFRRCLDRWDYSDTIEPQASFANYHENFVAYQNCIAIDGKDNKGQDVSEDGIKGFFTPNGGNHTFYEGCIVLNYEGAGYFFEESWPLTDISLKDCIAWGVLDAGQNTIESYDAQLLWSRGRGPLKVDKSTFGKSDLGLGIRMTASNDSFTNSIVNNVFLLAGNFALYGGIDHEDYNSFSDNTGGRNKDSPLGQHSLASVRLSDSLKYLPRIEAGSPLSQAGSDGGPIGATILKRIGRSGTLWGEPGWNETTDEDLWPFPNEDIMKEEVARFYKAPGQAYPGSPEMIGARGFAREGLGLYGGPITLTSYIWEYLGNPCPAEICDKAAPVCGNSICDSGETCGSCPSDCHSLHSADTSPCDGCLSDTELLAEISRWKAGASTMPSLLSAVSAWKAGCG